MTVPKIVNMVNSCGECPNYGYYSGRVYRCNLVEEAVLEKDRIAPFCPLPDYPSRVIKEMEITVLGLQKSVDYSYPFALFTFIAAKLKRTVSANGSTIRIPCRDGEVCLQYDHIRDLTLNPFSIRFLDADKTYVLCVDGIAGPSLSEVVRREGIDEELFHQIYLAA